MNCHVPGLGDISNSYITSTRDVSGLNRDARGCFRQRVERFKPDTSRVGMIYVFCVTVA